MFPKATLLFMLFLAVVTSSYDIQQLFGPSLSSGAEIFLPSYSNWTEDLQQRWSEWAAPTYVGAIKVATAEDVQIIVRKINIIKRDWNPMKIILGPDCDCTQYIIPRNWRRTWYFTQLCPLA